MRLRFTVHSRVANYLIVQYMDLVYLRTPQDISDVILCLLLFFCEGDAKRVRVVWGFRHFVVK